MKLGQLFGQITLLLQMWVEKADPEVSVQMPDGTMLPITGSGGKAGGGSDELRMVLKVGALPIIHMDEVHEEGFYWARLDKHRPWSVVYICRQAQHVDHPRHHLFEVSRWAGWCSLSGALQCQSPELIGPLTRPEI